MTRPPIITLSENAATYIRGIIDAQTNADIHHAEAGLRISLKKGGCSGQEYDFKYVDHKQAHDEIVKQHGVILYVDPAVLLNVIGSVMDYQESAFESGLIFQNPNEAGKCGCGKSVRFEIKSS